MSPAQTAIAMASLAMPTINIPPERPSRLYDILMGRETGQLLPTRWHRWRCTKLPHDKATKRRRARNKAARKSRQRNR